MQSAFGALSPVGIHFTANILYSFESLVLATGLLFLFDVSGLRLLRWMGHDRPQGVVRFSSPFVGYCVFSLALFGMAAPGLWFAPVLAGLLILAGVSGWADIRRVLLDWKGSILAVVRSLSALPGVFLAMVALAWLGLVVLPETNIDCMNYHLALPQQYLSAHRMFGGGSFLTWDYPLAVDLPNVIPVMFGLDAAGKALRPVMALLGGFALLYSLRTAINPALGIFTVIVAMMVPEAAYFVSSAKNDGVIAGTILLFSAFLVEWKQGRCRLPFNGLGFLVGVLGGLIASSKYVIYPYLAAAFVLFIPSVVKKPVFIPVMVAGILAPFIPWVLRSFLFSGDPLFPLGMVFMPGIFGSGEVGEMTRQAFWAHAWTTTAGLMPVFGSLSGVLPQLFPFLAAAGLASSLAGKGALIPMAGAVAGIAGLELVFPGNIHIVERFGYPFIAILNICGAGVLMAKVAGGNGNGWIRPVALSMALVAAVYQARIISAGFRILPAVTTADYVSGRLSIDGYRLKSLGAFGKVLPEIRKEYEARGGHPVTLSIGNPVVWDMPGRVIGEEYGRPFTWRVVHESVSVGRLDVKFKQAGVTWLVYNGSLADWSRFIPLPHEWSPRMLGLYREFFSARFRIRAFSGFFPMPYGNVVVYEKVARLAMKPGSMPFLPGTEHAFFGATSALKEGKTNEARKWFGQIRGQMPGVLMAERLYAESLGDIDLCNSIDQRIKKTILDSLR